MSDFEYLFALFSLLFGLIIAEIAVKFADAIDAHRSRPMGTLTPMLAILVVTDLCGFWMYLWAFRGTLTVNWLTVFTGVILAMVYFLAASLTFPCTSADCAHLDDHYWSRKRLVAAGLLGANTLATIALMTRAMPAWNDWWFYFFYPSYLAALGGLVLSRSRRWDMAFILWALLVNVVAGLDLAHSLFAIETGLVPQS